MHAYATDITNRSLIIFLIALVAILSFGMLAVVVYPRVPSLPYNLQAFALVGAGFLFSSLYWCFDRYVWRWQIWGRRLSAVPNLSGHYRGFVTIEREADSAEGDTSDARVDCYVGIEQRWSTICVRFETPFTTSVSAMAVLNMNQSAPQLNGLRYEYHVQPRSFVRPDDRTDRLEGMALHSGLARLLPACDRAAAQWTEMEGDYYNDPWYRRHGKYRLERIPEVDVEQWRQTLRAHDE